jgi:phage recombination protein Bet
MTTMTTEMVVRSAVEPLAFTEEQRKMIRDTFANGAADAEFAVLMEVAKARRLNPLLRQVHFVARWDSQKSRSVWAVQVSIDGLRAIAERTGLYAGQDDPEFVENPDGSIKLCKVRVYRKDWPRPAVGTAFWEEYVQTRRDKATSKMVTTEMWRRMPHVMIAKCAESLALRKAFPEDMSGLYTGEEMGQAANDDEEVEVKAAPPPAPPVRPALEAPAAQDKPEGSRAFAAFVLAVVKAATVTALLALYHGLVADLREEGHDPAEYLADGADDPAALGAASLVGARVFALGHRLAKVDLTALLTDGGERIAAGLDSQAEALAGKVGVDARVALVEWWRSHRAELSTDKPTAKVLYGALVRRWDGSDEPPDGPRTKKARAELERALQALGYR